MITALLLLATILLIQAKMPLAFLAWMGPMPWTVNSEIYPLWARSTGNACSSGVNWVFNVLVSLTFLHTAEYLTYYGAFFLYAGFAALGLVFIYGCLPETKGKKLEEIESLFENRLCTCGMSDSDEGRFTGKDWEYACSEASSADLDYLHELAIKCFPLLKSLDLSLNLRFNTKRYEVALSLMAVLQVSFMWVLAYSFPEQPIIFPSETPGAFLPHLPQDFRIPLVFTIESTTFPGHLLPASPRDGTPSPVAPCTRCEEVQNHLRVLAKPVLGTANTNPGLGWNQDTAQGFKAFQDDIIYGKYLFLVKMNIFSKQVSYSSAHYKGRNY
ncbi:hypothetical protein DUI87_13124 [Hirundo rustica rustica]|uniref:Major facilitator superfamily (MFS) profile domain-containing protein n=1 Tax=Hirundo rustica rustica TaxID=333673 RepID=A0A3M0KB17_HIRRU|nr:hypothetical protein DUI87_13124 [Hirundo rustica rustica]